MATMIVMAKDGKPTVLEDFPQTLFRENEHKSREMESRTGGSRYLRVSPSGLQQCFSLYLQQKQKDEGCTPEFERPQQNSRPPAVSYSAQIVAEVNDSSSPSVEPSFVELYGGEEGAATSSNPYRWCFECGTRTRWKPRPSQD